MLPSTACWTRLRRCAQPLLLSLSLFFVPTTSRLVNITVDDQLGDPITGLYPLYRPIQPPTWTAGSLKENCTRCNIQPYTLDLNQIHEQTWHDATYKPPSTPVTITVSFSGSAVYVFNIVPNSLTGTTTFANTSFSIDGEDVGSFLHVPDPTSSTILYNHLVYSNMTLQDGLHTLIMSGGGEKESLILFDYLLYTTDSNTTTLIPPRNSSSQSSSSAVPVGAIIGGVVGGIALALLGVVIAISCIRIRRRTMPQPMLKRINLTGGEGEDSQDGHLHSDIVTGVYRGRAGGGKYFAQPMIPTAPFFTPTMRPSNRSATRRPSHLTSGDDGPAAHLSCYDTGAEPTSTAGWSAKRRAELTRRLGALHRRISFLSSTVPSRSQVSGESGTEAEVLALRAEIAELRRVLASLSEQFAGERGRDSNPLSVYTPYQESTVKPPAE